MRSSSGKDSDQVKLNLFWFPLAVRWQDESQWKCVEWWMCHKSEKLVSLALTLCLYKLFLLIHLIFVIFFRGDASLCLIIYTVYTQKLALTSKQTHRFPLGVPVHTVHIDLTHTSLITAAAPAAAAATVGY